MGSGRFASNSALFTHREGALYVEHCKVVCSDGLLAVVRSDKAIEKHYSIPHANACVLLLGPGTSVTQQAAQRMAEQGMMFGFVGGGGTPLFMASQSEYRPTEYCQGWLSRWVDPLWRLQTAKAMALARCDFVDACYKRSRIGDAGSLAATAAFRASIATAASNQELLGHEAVFAKKLYAWNGARVGMAFKRQPQGDGANAFIDRGNYLAYGLAASALWILGIPHAFAVNHGSTRRGALVFDVADMIKDAALLPLAFDAASGKKKDGEHRVMCLAALDQHQALKFMLDRVKVWSS